MVNLHARTHHKHTTCTIDPAHNSATTATLCCKWTHCRGIVTRLLTILLPEGAHTPRTLAIYCKCLIVRESESERAYESGSGRQVGEIFAAGGAVGVVGGAEFIPPLARCHSHTHSHSPAPSPLITEAAHTPRVRSPCSDSNLLHLLYRCTWRASGFDRNRPASRPAVGACSARCGCLVVLVSPCSGLAWRRAASPRSVPHATGTPIQQTAHRDRHHCWHGRVELAPHPIPERGATRGVLRWRPHAGEAAGRARRRCTSAQQGIHPSVHPSMQTGIRQWR